MTTLYGIIFGLGAAASQCGAYLISRSCAVTHRQAYLGLLVTSHLYMGVFALALLPVVWPDAMPPLGAYIVPLAGATLFYVMGQGAMLALMASTNPSRVAPLLGAKILILALLATTLFGYSLSLLQLLAVFACSVAVFILNMSGGSLSVRALLMLLVACLGYALSDLHIHRLMVAFAELSPLRAALLGGALSYVFSGVLALVCLPYVRASGGLTSRGHALPFALLWYIAMIGLFTSIAYVGPVFAIILQSSRGLMAIVIGVVVAHIGHVHLEVKLTRRVLFQRIGAALLMALAISLYAYAA